MLEALNGGHVLGTDNRGTTTRRERFCLPQRWRWRRAIAWIPIVLVAVFAIAVFAGVAEKVVTKAGMPTGRDLPTDRHWEGDQTPGAVPRGEGRRWPQLSRPRR